MPPYLRSIIILLLLCRCSIAFPPWASLAGLSNEEIELFSRTVEVVGAQPPPGPDPNMVSTLVNDAAHPFQPPSPNNIRGPCPGLNTLASHGVSTLPVLTHYYIQMVAFFFTVPQPKRNCNPTGGCERRSNGWANKSF